MCARYELSASPRMIMERFKLDAPPPVPNRDDLRPTDQALIVDQTGARLMRWGLSVSWDGKPLFNARAETLDAKPTFRPLLEKRCLVPMTAYLEWRRLEDGTRRRNRIAPATGAPAAFAGLSDGEAFTIVTCEPAPAVAHIHDRMPVILDAVDANAWADSGRPFADVKFLLHPYEGALMFEEQVPERAQGELF
ncbi:MAG: SOS response-associated peptidase [Rhodospirillales bacterium CG15_BIG_FIL_POST_REV_8_21_14_020_66_15]|nr:MAG: SOS response-associated peptidase [Rhodospirillales bacterium CG15_BIG_FIL_POST_REV_8_21_14_020_66_15]